MPNEEAIDALSRLNSEIDAFIQESEKGHSMDQTDIDILRQTISFRACPEETYVTIVCIARDPKKNLATKIKCHRGTPLGGYTYDTVNDAYYVECADHFSLGLVPISFQAVVGTWAFYIPMQEIILTKYLTEKQRENLKSYRANFPVEEYTFEFMQLLH